MTRDEVLDGVRKALCEVVGAHNVEAQTDLYRCSLPGDLGVDSISIMELGLLLSEELPIGEYPVQRWLDAQAASDSGAYSVASVVDTCMELLGERAP